MSIPFNKLLWFRQWLWRRRRAGGNGCVNPLTKCSAYPIGYNIDFLSFFSWNKAVLQTAYLYYFLATAYCHMIIEFSQKWRKRFLFWLAVSYAAVSLTKSMLLTTVSSKVLILISIKFTAAFYKTILVSSLAVISRIFSSYFHQIHLISVSGHFMRFTYIQKLSNCCRHKW